MARLYKVEMYVLDINEDYYSFDDIMNDVENSVEAGFTPFNIQEVEFEWDDNIDLNKMNAPLEVYRNYFEED